jgi:hypothetical protein
MTPCKVDCGSVDGIRRNLEHSSVVYLSFMFAFLVRVLFCLQRQKRSYFLEHFLGAITTVWSEGQLASTVVSLLFELLCSRFQFRFSFWSARVQSLSFLEHCSDPKRKMTHWIEGEIQAQCVAIFELFCSFSVSFFSLVHNDRVPAERSNYLESFWREKTHGGQSFHTQ